MLSRRIATSLAQTSRPPCRPSPTRQLHQLSQGPRTHLPNNACQWQRAKCLPTRRAGVRYQHSGSSFREAREYLRNRPVIAFFAAVCSLGTLGWMYYVYWFNKYYIVGEFQRFPEPVAKQLRRALYYSNYSVSPRDAIKYWRRALAAADQLGMDPYSEEVLGMKIELAAFLERIGQIQQSMALIRTLHDECERWLGEHGNALDSTEQYKRIINMSIGMNLKLAELALHLYIQAPQVAEKNYNSAVETVLKVRKREEEQGVPNEQRSFSDEEMGATLEGAAVFYLQGGMSEMSAPLFLKAIELCSKAECNAANLMNGLVSSFLKDVDKRGADLPAAEKARILESSRLWTTKAQELAGKIQPPERTELCDQASATAVVNLGEIAECEGDLTEAAKRYEEGRSLSKAIGFEEGAEYSTERLEQLKKGSSEIDKS